MFDAVINHISRHSAWFQGFLRGEEPYRDYFIVVDPDTDLSQVVRPRALPLLTPVETVEGVKYVWTTFSEYQIDLNYANPRVALEIIDVLLFYAERGAQIIRLDAIAYLWKEIGTPCIHLPQTHAMVKLWRAVFDATAPDVLLITETNVPHEENISYFGEFLPQTGKTDEAQLVYNFTLAPLTLHAFLSGDATKLSRWAATLEAPPGATFFNFIASHDGIGVRPAEGILTPEEMEALVERTLAHGGQVGYKADPDGSRSVYELNITLYDFLNDPARPDPDQDVARFLASQSILLALAGVPGIYVHSLFGSRNCHACYQQTGRARSLNREKFDLAAIERLLADATSHQHRVFEGYRHMLALRRQHPAFHPFARQSILDLHPAVFAVVRTPADDAQPVLCLTNVSARPVELTLPAGEWRTLLGATKPRDERLTLPPYGVLWLAGD
jgi:sucrose phosphorylase